MRLIIQNDYETMSKWAAYYIASRIRKANPTPDNPFILGLPTGISPLGTYRCLVELNRNGEVSFKNVITFNMDEYAGIERKHPESYHSFMWNNLFRHIDIPAENVNIPDGNAPNLEEECERYEQKIRDAGGIELFLGGVGADGHIAFNEPFSSLNSSTRVKTLTTETIIANSRFFDNDTEKVPKTALTVGTGTIMLAREILILANGHSKARALATGIEGAISHSCTISVLQLHPRAIIVCDEAATDELKVGTYKYFKDIEKNHLDFN
ncbi:MAG: glucosamine-6-phosphate deaminase [Dysgonamonadaceae bacterium]|jgi:glucosamine-6-phosphate deaminase|nr:glucosamine-6-phosphate deaminase [Dysgonamonadaceae bacterium]